MIFISVFLDGSYHDFEVDRVVAPVINSIQHAEKEELPFLLWWTPFTGDQAKIKQCWEGKCLFSQNQSLYDHPLTKAFFFYGTDFHEDKVPLPRKGVFVSVCIQVCLSVSLSAWPVCHSMYATFRWPKVKLL